MFTRDKHWLFTLFLLLFPFWRANRKLIVNVLTGAHLSLVSENGRHVAMGMAMVGSGHCQGLKGEREGVGRLFPPVAFHHSWAAAAPPRQGPQLPPVLEQLLLWFPRSSPGTLVITALPQPSVLPGLSLVSLKPVLTFVNRP